MNLHSIASGAINAINPFQVASIRQSNGYTTGSDFTRIPQYINTTITVQVQAMSTGDLRQVEGLNLNGTKRKIYCNGTLAGTVRVTAKGGDIITIASGANAGVWLVATVIEQWPDWCSVAVTLQNGS